VSRVQLALNVSDIDQSVAFYTQLLGTAPTKREPGYANFAVVDPPLKLVLMEVGDQRGAGVAGALNHLGVEVGSPDEVVEATGRLAHAGLDTDVERGTTCCFALQDKVWVDDPDGAPWEVYTVLADAPSDTGIAGDRSCCTPPTAGSASTATGVARSACC
jgi:catechol 2,3-dioxygenase-like lactoylglutathione lyase family enzyme